MALPVDSFTLAMVGIAPANTASVAKGRETDLKSVSGGGKVLCQLPLNAPEWYASVFTASHLG